jgi:antitoxin YokJ
MGRKRLSNKNGAYPQWISPVFVSRSSAKIILGRIDYNHSKSKRISMIEILEKVLSEIGAIEDCKLYPVSQTPLDHLSLPADLKYFYSKYGGADLFTDGSFRIRIVRPEEFHVANRVIYGGFGEDALIAPSEDISWLWYVLAEYEGGDYISIDLSQERHGLCYDSGWVIHGGNSYIVALSFTEFLMRVIAVEGEILYWSEIKNRIGPYEHRP